MHAIALGSYTWITFTRHTTTHTCIHTCIYIYTYTYTHSRTLGHKSPLRNMGVRKRHSKCEITIALQIRWLCSAESIPSRQLPRYALCPCAGLFKRSSHVCIHGRLVGLCHHTSLYIVKRCWNHSHTGNPETVNTTWDQVSDTSKNHTAYVLRRS